MYKEVLESKIVKIIGEYGIVKAKEQMYFNNHTKLGREIIWYDVCLDKGDGDIVYSCSTLNIAKEWILKGE